ncbi:MAG: IS200/IS605 family transposase [Prevotella sp.]
MSYTKLYYHIVIVVKNRKQAIKEDKEAELFHYIWSLAKKKNVRLFRINAAGNHMHMLVSIPQDMCIADFVRDVKRSTTLMIHAKELLPGFPGWSREYCAMTVGSEGFDNVYKYIINQKTHHHTHTLEEEYTDGMDELSRQKFSLQFFDT